MRHRPIQFALAALAGLFVVGPVMADQVVYFVNGKAITVKKVEKSDKITILEIEGGGRIGIPTEQIDRIEELQISNLAPALPAPAAPSPAAAQTAPAATAQQAPLTAPQSPATTPQTPGAVPQGAAATTKVVAPAGAPAGPNAMAPGPTAAAKAKAGPLGMQPVSATGEGGDDVAPDQAGRGMARPAAQTGVRPGPGQGGDGYMRPPAPDGRGDYLSTRPGGPRGGRYGARNLSFGRGRPVNAYGQQTPTTAPPAATKPPGAPAQSTTPPTPPPAPQAPAPAPSETTTPDDPPAAEESGADTEGDGNEVPPAEAPSEDPPADNS